MDKTVGVLGGGQLGRMLTEAANRLNISLVILDHEGCPAKQINAHPGHVNGSFTDPKAIRSLAASCDVLTIEIEHVDTAILEDLSVTSQEGTRLEVQPSWRTIRVIQDKYDQKLHLSDNNIEVADSMPVKNPTIQNVEEVAAHLGYPCMLKSRTGAYDGRGNYAIRSVAEIPNALAKLRDRPLYLEKWAFFPAELAVIVVKVEDDPECPWEKSTIAYPTVETIHENSICKLVYVPARKVSKLVMRNAQILARRAVGSLWGRGVFGVEMFLLGDGKLLVNEIAPRPHNSGHYTIEACPLSQYEAHLRAILGLPIPQGSTQLISSTTFAIMLNLLGGKLPETHIRAAHVALSIPGASIHLYNKGEARPGRKMGHVTVLAGSADEAEVRARPLIELVDLMGNKGKITQSMTTSKAHQQPEAHALSVEEPVFTPNPLVAVTMGSDSDRFVLSAGINLLKELDIPHSVTITSAHRTPEKMFKFAREAASRGIRVIIAAAGGAAHLPGMVAAISSLPVIGIPVKGSVLDGNDSLLSIVQMPRGCPVATVAINNSVNAAQLAARILALDDANIRKCLEEYLSNQTASVIEKSEKMERVGFEAYDLKEET